MFKSSELIQLINEILFLFRYFFLFFKKYDQVIRNKKTFQLWKLWLFDMFNIYLFHISQYFLPEK
jgi:hypothetical protein